YVGQQFGRNAEPIVPHSQYRFVALYTELNGDYAPPSRVFDRVADDVGDDLLDAYGIALYADGCSDNFEPVLRLTLGVDRRGSPHEVAEVQHASFEGDLARDDATHIEQVVHQPRQVLDLPPNDEACARSRTRVCFRRFEHLDGRRYGTERIAQLVCQHGHEFVFGLTLLLGAIAAALCIQQLTQIS